MLNYNIMKTYNQFINEDKKEKSAKEKKVKSLEDKIDKLLEKE